MSLSLSLYCLHQAGTMEDPQAWEIDTHTDCIGDIIKHYHPVSFCLLFDERCCHQCGPEIVR